MASNPKIADMVVFSNFEFDLATGELYDNGEKVRLSGQPTEVLRYLIQRAGSLVSRDELRSALWPADTFVDFDHGLNSCIQRIRQALRDSVGSPQYIETLPKQGYRFIGEVKFPEPPAPAGVPESVLPPKPMGHGRPILQWTAATVLLMAVIATVWYYLIPRWRQTRMQQTESTLWRSCHWIISPVIQTRNSLPTV